VVFLLPIGIVALALAKLYEIASTFVDAVLAKLFPDISSAVFPVLLAITVLVGVAFLAGMFSLTRLGRGMFDRIEGAITDRVPMYTMVRQMIVDVAGGAEKLEGSKTRVVKIRLDDMTVIGFMVDLYSDTEAVVFLPGAPSAMSGTVSIVGLDRITDANMSVTDVFGSMRGLGSGLAATKDTNG
jgi:uncharacterized membrane protein